MNPEEIYEKLKSQFGEEKILAFAGEGLDPFIQIVPAAALEVARFLKDDKELAFDSLMCLSGVDFGPGAMIQVVYHLYSMPHRHKITVKAELPRDNPSLPSVESVWRTADWHEREAYDLLGIHFENHPDLRRMFLPEDWDGHPLRKDYLVQEFYHGMRVPYPEDENPDGGHYVFDSER